MCSSDDAVGLATRSSWSLLVGGDGRRGVRDDAVSLAAWATRSLPAGGDGGGNGDGAEGIHLWACGV